MKVNLTDEVALKEAKACDFQAEAARSRAENARLLQVTCWKRQV